MRIFGSERMEGILTKLGLEPGEAITHPWVNKALKRRNRKSKRATSRFARTS